METQRSVWIMVYVPLCQAVISKAILFWRTSLLIRDISVFSKDRLCWLLLKVFWMNLVRASMYAIMSSRSMEGTKMAAKWWYEWKTELGWQIRNLTGCTYHTCWLGEAALTGVRRWRGGGICQTRIPTFSPLNGVWSIPSIAHFNRCSL